MVEEITAGEGGVYVQVHVQPGSRRPGLMGRHGDALKIAVVAPPVGGRANQAVIEALAELLGLPARDFVVVGGRASRHKRLFAKGIDVPHAGSRIEAALSHRNG